MISPIILYILGPLFVALIYLFANLPSLRQKINEFRYQIGCLVIEQYLENVLETAKSVGKLAGGEGNADVQAGIADDVMEVIRMQLADFDGELFKDKELSVKPSTRKA